MSDEQYQSWLSQFDNYYPSPLDGVLRSDEWTTGGTWGNCWGDRGTHYSQDPKEIPIVPYLEKNHPNISFLRYRKIEKECITQKQSGESDYYGGYRETAYWECDLKKLFLLLKEFGEL